MEFNQQPKPVDLRGYRRIVLLTEGESTPFLAKTAISMLRYRGADVIAILDRHEVGKTASELFGVGGAIPVIASLDQAASPDALLIGIAPPGGKLPDAWRATLLSAIHDKVDIISGLHQFLANDNAFQNAASQSGARLIDVRRNHETDTGTGKDLDDSCFRVHTVGQDCSVGKMVTALEIQKELIARDVDAGFAATGQTGIMITGQGIPIDCVVSDFVNGATEKLVRQFQHHQVLLIEGQGCITHPAYSAVTLGLLHGSAPDAMIMCFEATRKTVKGFGDIPLKPLGQLIHLYEQMANARHPSKVIGVAMNSRLLEDREFQEQRRELEQQLQLPVVDVIREGAAKLAEAVMIERDQPAVAD